LKPVVLVLDAEMRSALAIIRSLGRSSQFQIITAGRSVFSMGRLSKYSKKFYRYDDPVKSKADFVKSLTDILVCLNPDYIFPCSDLTLLPIYTSNLYSRFKDKLILPDKQNYFIACDKKEMNDLAEKCNVRIPPRIDKNKIDNTVFPFVLKPSRSKYYVDNKIIYGIRTFITDESQLKNTLEYIHKFDPTPLLQQIVSGKGYGIFIAAKEGQIFASFAHQRIREIPPSGGMSTMRKSIHVNNYLLDAAKKLIKALNWTGIAMLEFKGESEEMAYFLEMNPRPWGSMDLAVSAGMDFPMMMMDIYVNKLNLTELIGKYNKIYQLNHHSQWIIGEFTYLGHIIISKKYHQKKTLQNIFKVFLDRPRKISYDTFKLKDPLPFFLEIIYVAKIVLKKFIGYRS